MVLDLAARAGRRQRLAQPMGCSSSFLSRVRQRMSRSRKANASRDARAND
jgi:hypothetical protein